MAKPIIVIMGPPGAGKGTQSQILAKRLKGVHLSSGQLLRDSGDEKILQVQASGGLVSSEEVQRIVAEAIQRVPADMPVILDGFTRKLEEAQWLNTAGSGLRPISKVICINVDKDESIQRSLRRGRTDDRAGALEERWVDYEMQVKPVLDYYRQQGVLVEVDGSGSVDAVAGRVWEALNG